MDVHEHKRREHQQSQDSRPLKQKTEHDDDEPDVLRMPDAAVDACRRQAIPLLSRE
jgi:hypothetical protein